MCFIIDEFDRAPKIVLNELMHTFRKMYHKKNDHVLHSVILVGVRNITDINLDNGSPFNIADEINLPYFTKKEIFELINQHIEETRQKFTKKVVDEIAFNTGGQPGLVNTLCRDLVENEVEDLTKTIRIEHFRNSLNKFLYLKIDKNISNIIKAKEERRLIEKILFEEEVTFSIYDDSIKNL